MSNANDVPAQGDTQQTDPGFVTAEQVAQIVNQAVTSQLGRILPKQLGTAIEAAMKPLHERFAAQPEPATPDKTEQSHRPDPQIVALQKQLADLQAANRASQEEVASERKRAREDGAFSALTRSLSGKVRPGTEDIVATLLRAKGQLVIDDEGRPSLKVHTSLFKGQAEADHEFPIEDGVGHYLKTKDAALFLPPPTGGAGALNQRAPNGPPRQGPQYDAAPTSPEEKARRVLEEMATLGAFLPGQ